MRFNNNTSIFSFYWSISYYLKIILNKILFSLVLILSFALLVLNKNNSNINSNIKKYINKISKPEIILIGSISNLFHNLNNVVSFFVITKKENILLKKKNINLQLKIIELTNVLNENKELKEILNFTSKNNLLNYTIKKINIISDESFVHKLDIDIKEDENIKEHNIVLDINGNYIGKIINVKNNKAEILLLTDTLSKIPAKLKDSQVKIILEGTGTKFLKINYFLGEKYNIKNNEYVYTSNDGNILQENILIGKIIKNKNNEYFVDIESRLNRINYVIIINNEN